MEKINNSKDGLNVLFLEDSLNDVLLIKEILIKEGYPVSIDIVACEKEFISNLTDKNYDIILSDYSLPGFDIYTALNLALEMQPEVPFICVSGTIGEETAVELLKLGATDYIQKDRPERLAFAVKRALEGVAKKNEWKKTVEALRESEERFRVLFECSTLGILATDIETQRFLYSNPAVSQLFGYTEQEFLNMSVADIHPKDALDFVMSEFIAQSRDEKKISSALPCLKKDGTIFYADISGTTSSFYGRKCNVGFFTDVTNRKQAEDAMRESENRFRNYIDNAPHGVFVADENGKYVDVNNAASTITGYTKEELLSMYLFELVAEESMDLVSHHFKELLSQGYTQLEFPFQKKDKSWGYWTVEAVKLSDQRFLGFAVEISKRRQAEEALQQSNAMYQVIFESTGTATFISEENTTIQMVNKECFFITGYSPEELVGQKWTQFFAPESLQKMLNYHELRRLNPELAPKKYEVKLINKNGELRDVIIEVGMIPFTKQSIISLLDITDLNQAQEALIKLKKAIDTSGEVIFITDIDGIFTFINPAFTALYGYSAEEIIGKATPRILKSGLSGKSLYEVFWTTLLKGDEVKWEIINKRKDGSLTNIEASATPVFDEKKNIIGFLGIQHDITNRKHAEQELIMAKEKAEESDRLKTAFLHNISHEIRTPFNGILGLLSLIQEDDIKNDERDQYIELINESADRLMQTINDIVEMSQIQTGQTKLEISDTNFKTLTDKLRNRYQTLAENKGLNFTIYNDIPSEISSINTDGKKLKTILSKLIVNAIKFTKEGSIDILFRQIDYFYEFSVKDTGVGISVNQQNDIFELFKQVDVTNTRQFEGLGLGLSIAKSYIDMLGGKIWLESKPGKGSTFYFKIPIGE